MNSDARTNIATRISSGENRGSSNTHKVFTVNFALSLHSWDPSYQTATRNSNGENRGFSNMQRSSNGELRAQQLRNSLSNTGTVAFYLLTLLSLFQCEHSGTPGSRWWIEPNIKNSIYHEDNFIASKWYKGWNNVDRRRSHNNWSIRLNRVLKPTISSACA